MWLFEIVLFVQAMFALCPIFLIDQKPLSCEEHLLTRICTVHAEPAEQDARSSHELQPRLG
jgi:hypothetical protein